MIFYMKKIKEKYKIDKRDLIYDEYSDDYIYWQEYVSSQGFVEYEYYYDKEGIRLCRTTDKNKIRQDLIDEILKS